MNKVGWYYFCLICIMIFGCAAIGFCAWVTESAWCLWGLILVIFAMDSVGKIN
ncbi:hypothetical protein KR505_19310 [Eubacterium callanderi]|uniref:hypothetical protein n=1 Tax=Eubacterium callanderi TaxID=53442 RepID=UPI001C2D2F9A|nr:hypothetical protein [Eubacterium callanderi]MBV1685549.1 hypothetical protein [Eubacterium callanderi]